MAPDINKTIHFISCMNSLDCADAEQLTGWLSRPWVGAVTAFVNNIQLQVPSSQPLKARSEPVLAPSAARWARESFLLSATNGSLSHIFNVKIKHL